MDMKRKASAMAGALVPAGTGPSVPAKKPRSDLITYDGDKAMLQVSDNRNIIYRKVHSLIPNHGNCLASSHLFPS